MTSRRQKVQALLSDMQSLRRTIALRGGGSAHLPRITPSQWGVLMFIEQHGESTLKEAAYSLGITSSAATQLVDGLVAGGYLTRKAHAEDRRSVTLALSKKSTARLATMKKHALARFLKIFAVLNDREFNQYLALNKKIVLGSLPKNNL